MTFNVSKQAMTTTKHVFLWISGLVLGFIDQYISPLHALVKHITKAISMVYDLAAEWIDTRNAMKVANDNAEEKRSTLTARNNALTNAHAKASMKIYRRETTDVTIEALQKSTDAYRLRIEADTAQVESNAELIIKSLEHLRRVRMAALILVDLTCIGTLLYATNSNVICVTEFVYQWLFLSRIAMTVVRWCWNHPTVFSWFVTTMVVVYAVRMYTYYEYLQNDRESIMRINNNNAMIFRERQANATLDLQSTIHWQADMLSSSMNDRESIMRINNNNAMIFREKQANATLDLQSIIQWQADMLSSSMKEIAALKQQLSRREEENVYSQHARVSNLTCSCDDVHDLLIEKQQSHINTMKSLYSQCIDKAESLKTRIRIDNDNSRVAQERYGNATLYFQSESRWMKSLHSQCIDKTESLETRIRIDNDNSRVVQERYRNTTLDFQSEIQWREEMLNRSTTRIHMLKKLRLEDQTEYDALYTDYEGLYDETDKLHAFINTSMKLRSNCEGRVLFLNDQIEFLSAGPANAESVSMELGVFHTAALSVSYTAVLAGVAWTILGAAGLIGPQLLGNTIG